MPINGSVGLLVRFLWFTYESLFLTDRLRRKKVLNERNISATSQLIMSIILIWNTAVSDANSRLIKLHATELGTLYISFTNGGGGRTA